jgi:hypothetical protein
MRATRLLLATSSGVGVNMRRVGYGLALSGYPRIYNKVYENNNNNMTPTQKPT